MRNDNPDPEKPDPETERQPPKPGLKQVIMSVLAAVFGIQTQENRERDFKKGDPRDYIAVYVVLVIALVIGMIVVVKMVLEAAGA